MPDIIYRENDHLIELNDLKDSADDSVLSTATVSAQLKDVAGTNIGAAIPMSATATAGQYQGTVPSTQDLSAYDDIVVEVSASDTGRDALFKLKLRVRERNV